MRRKAPPKRPSSKKTTGFRHCTDGSELAALGPRGVELSAINAIAARIRRSRLCEKTFYFVVVRFERVAHDEKVAAVTGDRVPVDNVREIAILKKSDCPRPT